MADAPDITELLSRLEAAEARAERLRDRAERLEVRAEHAERLATLGRLLAGVVHEINNPLMAVTMYADALAARLDEPDREKAAAILEAGQRIQKLARELVSYARPRKEPDQVHPLSDLVDEGLHLCRSELKGASALLERTDAPGPAPTLRGKRASLVQVVVALVANATAAGEGHKIRVGVAGRDGEAVLTVADEGAGMSPDVLARAFEPFFTTRPEARLGLGLCTAKEIVERHGGRIALASEAGRGTTATVVLPIA